MLSVLSEVGADLREAGRVNCLGAELPQKRTEMREAVIKTQLLEFDSLRLSHKR